MLLVTLAARPQRIVLAVMFLTSIDGHCHLVGVTLRHGVWCLTKDTDGEDSGDPTVEHGERFEGM